MGFPLGFLIAVCQYVDMVCIYCGSETSVTNSRLQKRRNSVWRRRKCLNPDCGAIFSTGEAADYEKTWVVQSPGGALSPFLRDKLFVSIYKACQHRPSALEDAIGLTDTVMNAVLREARNGSLAAGKLTQAAYTVLKRFDQPAAISYQAFHTDVLKRG